MQQMIDHIWQTYDTNHDGKLDKSETKKMMIEILQNIGLSELYSDSAFNQVFAQFDIDVSGTIERNELDAFIKGILG